MHTKPADQIHPSKITPENVFLNRRAFIRIASAAGIGLASSVVFPQLLVGQDRWPQGEKGPFDVDDEVNKFNDITTYNNFYEFGVDKSDPSENSVSFRPKPWTVRIEGEVKKPATYNLDDIVKPSRIEDRIYRHRCVEGWSMVIPWRGFPLADLIKRNRPRARSMWHLRLFIARRKCPVRSGVFWSGRTSKGCDWTKLVSP